MKYPEVHDLEITVMQLKKDLEFANKHRDLQSDVIETLTNRIRELEQLACPVCGTKPAEPPIH